MIIDSWEKLRNERNEFKERLSFLLVQAFMVGYFAKQELPDGTVLEKFAEEQIKELLANEI